MHYRLVTVKVKLGLLNFYRPAFAVSIAIHSFLCFPSLLVDKKNPIFHFYCNSLTEVTKYTLETQLSITRLACAGLKPQSASLDIARIGTRSCRQS